MADRDSGIGRWLATGGAALLALMLLTAAAVEVIVADVVPRFRSPAFSVPPDRPCCMPASKAAPSSIEPRPSNRESPSDQLTVNPLPIASYRRRQNDER
jgi:hypothetical protein